MKILKSFNAEPENGANGETNATTEDTIYDASSN